ERARGAYFPAFPVAELIGHAIEEIVMPVAIGGMHRSGTSMTARLLNVMGTYMGEESDLVPATAENPEGYWEHQGFVDVNDEILHELGGGWDCPVALPAQWKNEARLAPLQIRARQVI